MSTLRFDHNASAVPNREPTVSPKRSSDDDRGLWTVSSGRRIRTRVFDVSDRDEVFAERFLTDLDTGS